MKIVTSLLIPTTMLSVLAAADDSIGKQGLRRRTATAEAAAPAREDAAALNGWTSAPDTPPSVEHRVWVQYKQHATRAASLQSLQYLRRNRIGSQGALER